MRKIIHVDMDCFYAAVEMRDNPNLINHPVAVGGQMGQRGVICTSNYLARQFGVKSAMATAVALKKCPELIVLPPKIEKYRKIAYGIRHIFNQYSALVEPLSLDEAYIDVSQCSKLSGSATWIAQEIRREIKQQFGLTASAGVSCNKFLAKVASDHNKPDGQFVIPPEAIETFIKSMPVTSIFGVGKVTAKKLLHLGIETCEQLQGVPLTTLTSHFGKFGSQLYAFSRGIDERPVLSNRSRKSLSVEHTFAEDLLDKAVCQKALGDLFAALMMRWEKLSRPQVNRCFLKLKFNDFSLTSKEASCNFLSISVLSRLLHEAMEQSSQPIRLMGVGLRLKPASMLKQLQLDLNS